MGEDKSPAREMGKKESCPVALTLTKAERAEKKRKGKKREGQR